MANYRENIKIFQFYTSILHVFLHVDTDNSTRNFYIKNVGEENPTLRIKKLRKPTKKAYIKNVREENPSASYVFVSEHLPKELQMQKKKLLPRFSSVIRLYR